MNYNPQNLIKISKIRKKNTTHTDTSFGDRPSHRDTLQEFTNYPQSVIEFDLECKLLHPTQKPVALFEYLIKTYTNEGNIVLDNCAGSGTTGIACIRHKRKYILIEKEEKYCEIAARRIESELDQNTITLEEL